MDTNKIDGIIEDKKKMILKIEKLLDDFSSKHDLTQINNVNLGINTNHAGSFIGHEIQISVRAYLDSPSFNYVDIL